MECQELKMYNAKLGEEEQLEVEKITTCERCGKSLWEGYLRRHQLSCGLKKGIPMPHLWEIIQSVENALHDHIQVVHRGEYYQCSDHLDSLLPRIPWLTTHKRSTTNIIATNVRFIILSGKKRPWLNITNCERAQDKIIQEMKYVKITFVLKLCTLLNKYIKWSTSWFFYEDLGKRYARDYLCRECGISPSGPMHYVITFRSALRRVLPMVRSSRDSLLPKTPWLTTRRRKTTKHYCHKCSFLKFCSGR